MTGIRRVDELLQRHFAETAEGLVGTPPSGLRRGEGTERPYFLMKIDLVKSTRLLMNRKPVTYLRLAHTFLSTVDRITQDYGADGDQVEYGGDGLMVYFPTEASAENVLQAASFSRAAVERIQLLGGTVGELKLRCRIVLHHAPLIVAKIGPRAGTTLTAIGMPLHHVSKIEKEQGLKIGQGWATEAFYAQLARANRKYLTAQFVEETYVPPPAPPATSLWGSTPLSQSAGGLRGLLDAPPSTPAPRNALADLLYRGIEYTATPAPTAAPTTCKRLVGYDINWMLLNRDLGVPLLP